MGEVMGREDESAATGGAGGYGVRVCVRVWVGNAIACSSTPVRTRAQCKQSLLQTLNLLRRPPRSRLERASVMYSTPAVFCTTHP